MAWPPSESAFGARSAAGKTTWPTATSWTWPWTPPLGAVPPRASKPELRRRVLTSPLFDGLDLTRQNCSKPSSRCVQHLGPPFDAYLIKTA